MPVFREIVEFEVETEVAPLNERQEYLLSQIFDVFYDNESVWDNDPTVPDEARDLIAYLNERKIYVTTF